MYRSQSKANAECNYGIYDKEMLAIIRALEDWQHYLKGLPDPFTIITDHCNLQFWCSIQNLTCQQAQWSLYLRPYTNTLLSSFTNFFTSAIQLFSYWTISAWEVAVGM